MRIDQLLVRRGLAPSRSAAQRLIAVGAVRWRAPAGWTAPTKAGDDVPDDCELQLTDDAELRYVSRGGLKLEGALAASGVDPRGMVCLDLGQSTGDAPDVFPGGTSPPFGPTRPRPPRAARFRRCCPIWASPP